MKYIVNYMLVALSFIMFQCVKFPNAYEVIESEKVRLLDFIYEPAEAVPGDTVLLTAIFAGKHVTSDMLTWRCSQQIIVNQYGTDAALDTVPLKQMYIDTTFSENTSCIAFKFVIPTDFLDKSPYIPENWTTILPDYYRSFVPAGIPADKHVMFALVDTLSRSTDFSTMGAEAALLPALLQCLSAPMYIYCDIHNDHIIQSEFVIRYNRRFSSLPGSPIRENRNPHVDSAFIYSVEKENLVTFDPGSTKFSFTKTLLRSDSANQLSVDNKRSYFIAVFTSPIDSALSIDAALGHGKALPEHHYSFWYLHFDDAELTQSKYSERSVIENGVYTNGQLISRLYPPLTKTISSVITWVEVDDSFINERCRPAGSTVREYSLHFVYE